MLDLNTNRVSSLLILDEFYIKKIILIAAEDKQKYISHNKTPRRPQANELWLIFIAILFIKFHI